MGPIFRLYGSSLLQVPAPFEYARATSVDNAIELLSELGPEARLLAGGHSLLPMMKLRLASPEYLIDIDPLAGELGYVTGYDHEVRIGALARHRGECHFFPFPAHGQQIFSRKDRSMNSRMDMTVSSSTAAKTRSVLSWGVAWMRT